MNGFPFEEILNAGATSIIGLALILTIWLLSKKQKNNGKASDVVAKYLVEQFTKISESHTQALGALRDDLRSHSEEARARAESLRRNGSEVSGMIRELCRYLKDQATNEQEHRLECRDAFRRIENREELR